MAVLLGASSTSPTYDLLQIEHLNSKGRVQDPEYQRQGPVMQAILQSGKAAIPVLIDLIESERPYTGSPLDFWPEVREGDMALIILSDLFLDPTWRQSTLPELCWDNLLERADSAVPAWDLLERYIRSHGRAALTSRWRAAWLEHETKIVWDDDGRFFKVVDRELVPCRLTQN